MNSKAITAGMRKLTLTVFTAALLASVLTAPAALAAAAEKKDDAQSTVEPASRERMTNARLGQLLKSLDPKTSGGPGNWVITFRETSAQVVTDENADRMRIMIPIADASDLEVDVLYRMLQANFESALDARYAIAQGLVWVAYIHPLSPLTEGELLLALAQTYNAAETFGTSYSGGLFQFGGGDNRGKAFDDILERGTQL